MPRSPEEKFWAKVDRIGECWVWTGSLARGYGQLRRDGRLVGAHRYSYLIHHGVDVPDGMDLGHACHDADPNCLGGPTCPHRRCVNPDHLVPMTRAENARAGNHGSKKTHCPHGHHYDEANTWVDPRTGHRSCRACNRERQRKRRLDGPICSVDGCGVVRYAKGLCPKHYYQQRRGAR